MNRKRRKRANPWRIILLLILIGGAVYINQVIVPVTPPLFIPTPTPTRSPESFVNEAINYYEEGRLLQAIDAYKSSILSDPNNANNYFDLARIQILAGQYEDAQENAELGLLKNPNSPVGHSMRAWALNFQDDYLAAEAAVKNALEVNPDSALAHAIYAEILINKSYSNQGDFSDIEDAIQESRTAQDLDPTMMEVRRARGIVLYATQNYEEAITEFNAANDLNNKISNTHLYLGYAYRAVGEYDLAVQAYNQANALNPGDPIPDYEASRVYFQVGEFSRAVQYAEQAVKDDPGNPLFQGNLGVMLAKDLRQQDAIDHLELAVRGGFTSDGVPVEGLPLDYSIRVIEFYSSYGLTLARTNQCEQAIPIFQTMLSLVPNDDIAVFNAEEGLRICQENAESLPEGTEGEAAGDTTEESMEETEEPGTEG
jgi:tetratricopeptide (TPR) repeat protein